MIHRILLTCAFFAALFPLPALAAACKADISIPNSILQQRLVIVGELHGTRETPDFVGELSCVLASSGSDLTVALEIPEAEQDRISNYLNSQGSPADASTLLASDFWNRPTIRQDGRSSGAMYKLIERLRQLRGTSERVEIIAIDGQRGDLTRDGAMAQIVREHLRSNPRAHVVALVGNVHALKGRGAFFNKDYESLAFLLSDQQPISLNVSPKRGFAWVCVDECGPRKLSPQAWVLEREPGVYLGQGPDAPPRYHGTVVLEQAQASPPVHAK